MKISGFTIIRNAVIYDFPVVECIKSLLDLVDEFVIVLGDSSDETEELIKGIESDKIKIINSNWDTSKYNKDGMVYASQTDIALKACTGDWCFYIQADEVLHENAIPIIRRACKEFLDDKSVDGFLLRYVHLYADFKHYIDAQHFGYPKEVRIVRNIKDMHSWRDAQSFRKIPNFDYQNYWQKEGTQKLNCVLLKDAFLYHYGWCRNPRKMVKKCAEQYKMHSGNDSKNSDEYHDYGNIDRFPIYKPSQPKVMEQRIDSMSWGDVLKHEGAPADIKKIFGLKYRFIGFFEKHFMSNGNRIFGFKNYKQVKIYK